MQQAETEDDAAEGGAHVGMGNVLIVTSTYVHCALRFDCSDDETSSPHSVFSDNDQTMSDGEFLCRWRSDHFV